MRRNPPVRLVRQRGADHLGGVGAPRLQRGRQQDVGGGAVAAPHPPRAHGHRRRTERADGAFARVPPFGQRTAAARAAHDGVGEPGLGVLGSADDDHCRTLRSRCISVAYHTPDWGRGQFVLGATAFGSVPSLTVPTTPTGHDAPRRSIRRARHRLHHRTSPHWWCRRKPATRTFAGIRSDGETLRGRHTQGCSTPEQRRAFNLIGAPIPLRAAVPEPPTHQTRKTAVSAAKENCPVTAM